LAEAQEKITPDSQKSYADKAKEGVTNTADDVAGLVQPGLLPPLSSLEPTADSNIGDSKSTTQKLSDETSSKTSSAQDSLSGASKNVQETASNIGKSAQDNAGAAQESSKGYLNQAQDVASNTAQSAQDTASQYGQKASETAGAAQETGKGYLAQAQEVTASALNTASKAAAGTSYYHCHWPPDRCWSPSCIFILTSGTQTSLAASPANRRSRLPTGLSL
jgi:hypothetical protein